MTTNDFIKGDYGYTANINSISITIREELNDELITYADRILSLYLTNKQKIFSYILNDSVRSFYNDRFTDIEITKKLHDADIEIISENWGSFVWLNSELDEHIVQVEFNNDMDLSYVSIDG
jgi:hypothetical protein